MWKRWARQHRGPGGAWVHWDQLKGWIQRCISLWSSKLVLRLWACSNTGTNSSLLWHQQGLYGGLWPSFLTHEGFLLRHWGSSFHFLVFKLPIYLSICLSIYLRIYFHHSMGTGYYKPHKNSKSILGIQDPLYQAVGYVAKTGGKYFWGSEEQRGTHSHFMLLSSDQHQLRWVLFLIFDPLYFSLPKISMRKSPKVETGNMFSYEPKYLVIHAIKGWEWILEFILLNLSADAAKIVETTTWLQRM